MRLDQYLVEQQLVESRSKAQAIIRSGNVLIDEKICDKPGMQVKGSPNIRLRTKPCKYVSRGGLKLEAALQQFDFTPQDLTIADLGASTGGFTDCLLQHGARKVYAIDVGYGQLAWKLRTDERVTVLERTNVRTLESLPEKMDALVGDLSFISLTKIIPAMKRLTKPHAQAVLLIKPQFEAGIGQTSKGLIKDNKIRQKAIDNVVHAFTSSGLMVINQMPSPIAGAKKGNIEHLIHLRFSQ